MSPETKRVTLPSEPKAPPQESIFNYYSIDNEVAFIRNADLASEETRFYLKENVIRFLGEFAGHIPYTKISYSLRPDGFYFADFKVEDSYRVAADLAGPESREEAEFVGFSKIQEHFASGGKTATWISPSKIADYGFVFHFVREGDRVNEYILRYSERLGRVDSSAALLSRIHPASGGDSFDHAHDFLIAPALDTISPTQSALQDLLRAADIDTGKIEASFAFERAVEEQLSPLIEKYIEKIFELAALRPGYKFYDEDKIEARNLMKALFNAAVEMEREPSAQEIPWNLDIHDNLIGFAAYYARQGTATVAGGSCPVTRTKSFLSSNSIIDGLKSGISLNSMAEGDYFECPKCDGKIPSGEGRTSCPHCGLTKEAHAKEVGVTCD